MENNTNDHFKQGYTKIPHGVLHALMLLDIHKRELKVLLLIIRLTYGCGSKKWASFKKYDLRIIGITPSHAGDILKNLITKQLLTQNGTKKEYRINEDFLISEVTEKGSFNLEKLGTLIGKQLKNYTSQKSNQEVPKKGTQTFPKEKVGSSQNGNPVPFPKREVIRSERDGFSTPKDILNINKNSDRDSIAISNKREQSRWVDPTTFSPSTEGETAALLAWQAIEPGNPRSFNFYLKAMHNGLPTSKFYEFSSEIKQDPTIDNKGAVFNKKVRDYLEENKK